MKPRRTQATIFYDLLVAIKQEQVYGEIKLTRVQLHSKLSYEKMQSHLQIMYELRLINHTKTPHITSHGYNYMKDFAEMQLQAFKMSQKYNFDIEPPQVGTTLDHMEFILNVAGTLKDAAEHLTAWTDSQKAKEEK